MDIFIGSVAFLVIAAVTSMIVHGLSDSIADRRVVDLWLRQWQEQKARQQAFLEKWRKEHGDG